MCIRDRYKLLSLLMAFALLVTTCLPMSAMAAGTEGADCVTVSSTAPTEAETVAGAKYELDPVSYTHLDVYKRQV